MNTHSHIVIICSRLDLPGGIEKASIGLANLFANHQHTVTLVIAEESREAFYPVSPLVKQIHLPLTFGIGTQKGFLSNKLQFLRDVRTLRKTLKQLNASAIISTEYAYTCAMVLAANRKTTLLISWEHHHYYGLSKSNRWQSLIKFVYPKLHAVVCPNDDEAAYYKKAGYGAVAIPHFLPLPSVNPSPERKKEILTIGWLSVAKGTELLLPAAKRILDKYPEWTWRLIGKGDMLAAVETFIESNNLQNRLIITQPVSPDLSSYYQTASILAHPSRKEAFGLVIAEAMSYGLPVVAFDCPTGPRHIIKSGEDGILVKDGHPDDLSDALSALIQNHTTRIKMGENAFQSAKRFSPASIYEEWKKLITHNP